MLMPEILEVFSNLRSRIEFIYLRQMAAVRLASEV